MTLNKKDPTSETTPDEHASKAPTHSYDDYLKMPQDDDPAGDGHMWSGKTPDPETEPDEPREESDPLSEPGKEPSANMA